MPSLRYLYCDEIYLEADNVLATLYVAKKYIVPHLARACVNYLETSLTAKNACLLLSQSRLFEEPELMQRCWEVIDAQVCDRLDTLHLNQRTNVNDIENCANSNSIIQNDANSTDTGNAIVHFPIRNNSWERNHFNEYRWWLTLKIWLWCFSFFHTYFFTHILRNIEYIYHGKPRISYQTQRQIYPHIPWRL